MSELFNDLASFYDDPLGYVYYIFPWGEGQLANHDGPRQWQIDYLKDLGEQIKDRGFDGVTPTTPIQISTTSGHGIGKSALTAWLIKFIMDTRPFCKGTVTANTSDQLKTKTWAELGKWHNMSLTKNFFDYNASKGNMSLRHKEHPENWRCDAYTCKEENSESFAGQHAAGSTPFYIFDEASGVPEKIYEVAQGGLTDGEPMFLLFGNPTRNTGYFRNTFSKFKHRWVNKQIDSRDVEGTNKELFEKWVEDYGEDSDYVRVRVRGQFPRASVTQLISSELVTKAQKNKLHPSKYDFAPVVLGVDVAWMGGDRSVIFKRQGLASELLWEGREVDSVDIAGLVVQYEKEHKSDAVFVDAGMGNGVIDQLRRLGRNPIPVYFGSRSFRNDCLNKRVEMWVEMRDWLKMGPVIPDINDLFDDLTAPEYHNNIKGQIVLESKDDMRKRGLNSPDLADALALTFAQPVTKMSEYQQYEGKENLTETDYDIFG